MEPYTLLPRATRLNPICKENRPMSTIDEARLNVEDAGSRLVAWPKSAVRVAFGTIWLIDAILKWQPAFRAEYLGMLQDAAKGQPAWLAPWFSFVTGSVSAAPTLFAYLTAIIETLIAAALILGFARKLVYILAAAFSVVIWATAEGFGGPYTTGATDIGSAIIYTFVFISLLAVNYQAGPSRFSLDWLIEKRRPGWRAIAEVGRHHAGAGHGA